MLPTLLILGGTFFLLRGGLSGGGGGGGGGFGNIFKIGKSPAKKINKELVTTRFADVAGCDEAKREVCCYVCVRVKLCVCLYLCCFCGLFCLYCVTLVV